MVIELKCEGECGRVWEGEEIEHWNHGTVRVIEAVCEECYRRLHPGSADIAGFVGFLNGWLVTVQ